MVNTKPVERVRSGGLPLAALNHISVVCRSLESSVRFYRDVLGFVPIRRPGSFDFDGAWCVTASRASFPWLDLFPFYCLLHPSAIGIASSAARRCMQHADVELTTDRCVRIYCRLFNYGIGIHLLQAEDPESMPPKKTEINPKDNHISFQVCMHGHHAAALSMHGS